MALPRFVVLKSVYNQKYLSLTKGEDEGLPTGFVKFDGAEVVSPRAKFELEMAKSSENKKKGLVHIRCCYNNKYLVRNLSGNEGTHWIVAGAGKPDDDQSASSCTLFEPVDVNKQSDDHADNRVQFRHIQLKCIACLSRVGQPMHAGMYLGSELPDKDLCDVYTVMDWERLVLLPQHVAFKCDNGKYLCGYWRDSHPYQMFSGNEWDEKAEYEVFTTANGCVRIKSVYFGKFWRRSPNWIWSDESDDSSDNPDVLFWPVKVNDNVVALRNMGNKKFCKRFTADDKEDCLSASTTTISALSQLVVEELVISRRIYNLDFRVFDARTYNESLITLATGGAVNDSYGTEQKTFTLMFAYKDIKISTWNANVSLNLGVKAELKVSSIPLIMKGKIEISAEFSTEYQWGETHTTETALEAAYAVVVPPRTKTTVTMVATRASCDVPFSYTQSDILFNGDPVIKHMDDGLYIGSNNYHVNFTEKQEKL